VPPCGKITAATKLTPTICNELAALGKQLCDRHKCPVDAVHRIFLCTAVGRPAVEHCLEGFNVAVIAYGQTGAGKTHSMIGVLPPGPPAPRAIADDPTSQAGLAPRVFEALFEGLGRQRGDAGRPVSTSRGCEPWAAGVVHV